VVSGIRVPGLQIPSPAAATVVVGPVGMHFNEVFLPHDGLHNIAQILRHRIPVTLAHDLTRILNRELHLQILVPIRVDLEFSFPDPFGVILVDACNLKIIGDIEFFQSCQD
jgi:hypothetical protein